MPLPFTGSIKIADKPAKSIADLSALSGLILESVSASLPGSIRGGQLRGHSFTADTRYQTSPFV